MCEFLCSSFRCSVCDCHTFKTIIKKTPSPIKNKNLKFKRKYKIYIHKKIKQSFFIFSFLQNRKFSVSSFLQKSFGFGFLFELNFFNFTKNGWTFSVRLSLTILIGIRIFSNLACGRLLSSIFLFPFINFFLLIFI